MSKNKQKLGRGLEALLNEGNIENESLNQDNKLIFLDPKLLKPNPEQPRTVFSDEALEELSASIKEHGVIQPVVAKKSDNGEYYIIAGERRTRASILANLSEIPVLISDIDKDSNLEIALIENIQREDLNPIEEAKAYKAIIDMKNLNQDELSSKIGKSRSTIANSLRLLNLPNYVQDALEQRILTPGHARAILAANTESEKKMIFDKICAENLSVRDTELLVSELKTTKTIPSTKKPNNEQSKPIEIKDLEEQLISALGTKVNIKGSMSNGSIEISYFSSDDLNALFEKLVNTKL